MPLLVILSPTKTLDFVSALSKAFTARAPTLPAFTGQADVLNAVLKTKSRADLNALFGASAPIVSAAQTHLQEYIPSLGSRADIKTALSSTTQHLDITKYRPAALAYKGPAFVALAASSFSGEAVSFSQGHLRILSAKYGVLRPLDLIQPYRLAMADKVEVKHKGSITKRLIDFWNEAELTVELMAGLPSGTVIINAASDEYWKSIDQSVLETTGATVIKCVFTTAGRESSVYSKQGRGLIARYVCENQLTDVAQLHDFDLDGYNYSAAQSSDDRFVFIRASAPKKQKKNKANKSKTTSPRPEKKVAKKKVVTTRKRGVASKQTDPTRVSTRARKKNKR